MPLPVVLILISGCIMNMPPFDCFSRGARHWRPPASRSVQGAAASAARDATHASTSPQANHAGGRTGQQWTRGRAGCQASAAHSSGHWRWTVVTHRAAV